MSLFKIFKKFTFILSHHQKFRIIELAFLMIVGGILETCSVALMMPFMNTVMNPEETMELKYVKIICNICGIHSHRTFLIILAVVLALIYIYLKTYTL